MTIQSDIQALYIAYFNRPADFLGLQYWTQQAQANGGSVAAVANAFSASPEYTSLYEGKSATTIINTIYQNLFGRAAEPDALAYWGTRLQNGTFNIGNIANSILIGAQNDDKIAIENKKIAAQAFYDSLDTTEEIEAYEANSAVVREWLRGITTKASLDAATTDEALNALTQEVITEAQGSINQGSTFTLTAATDKLVGTVRNDTFNATTTLAADGTTAIATTNALDSVDGGDGVDTLNIENTGSVNTMPANVKNVEIVNFLGAGNVNANGAITAAAGVTNINLVSTTDVAVTVNGVTTQNLGLNKVADATVLTAAYAASATAAALTATDLVGDATFSVSGTGLTSVSVKVNGTENNKTLTVTDTGATVTSATITATDDSAVKVTGTKVVNLTVTGAGAVDLTGTTVDLKTLTATANTGGVTYDNTTSATNTLTATTGAGDDTLTLVGGQLTSAATGAGDDTVNIVTTAVASGKTVDLGAGDDTLNLGAVAAGATFTGGEGTDTLGLALADYTTVAGFSSANLNKISGFEILSITGAALAGGDTLALGKIAGVNSAQILGVATGGSATVNNVGAASSIILKGDLATNNGDLVVALKDATGGSDVLNLTLDATYTQDNNGTATANTGASGQITAEGVETINFTSTGTASAAVTAGAAVDTVVNTLDLVDTALVTLNITGDQGYSFTSAAGSEALATVNAAAATGAGTINVAAASVAVTVTGSATASTTITGSAKADTIVGGAAADVITGGAGADKLTGGAGNDVFVYTAGAQSTLANLDQITDFTANTVGNGTNGAAGTGATATAADRNGDIIRLDVGAGITKVVTSVQGSAADAQVFLQNTADANTDSVGAVLDTSSNRLYIDLDSNGTVDSVIQLTGVTTITAAAFELV